MKTAQAHAIGWSAECPYCEKVQEVSPECQAPEGNEIECEDCMKTFKIEGVWGVD
jgi:hypothetical protein